MKRTVWDKASMVPRFLTATSVALLSLLAVLTHTAAHATPIGYAFEASNVSGTLNGTSFSQLTLLIAGIGDTTGIFVDSNGNLDNPLSLPSFNLTTTGGTLYASGTFTDSMFVFDNQTFTETGVPGQGVAGFFDGTTAINAGVAICCGSNAFATYDLSTSIGPVGGLVGFAGGGVMATTAGALSILTFDIPSAFFIAALGSTSVPEPSVWLLLSIGFGAVAAWRRVIAS